MRVELFNPWYPEHGTVAVEFPISAENYETVIEQLTALEIGKATEHDCCAGKVEGAPAVLSRLREGYINVDELDYLARRLDSFDQRELVKFNATAHLLDVRDVQDFINLTFCCQQATVISSFNNLKAIGINHYLTVNGGAPVEEAAKQDSEQIALDLIAEGQGKVTPFGVVYENAMRLTPYYTGAVFPAYADTDFLLEVDLLPAPAAPEDSPGTVLYLPMSEKRLERLLERASIYTNEDLRLESWFSELPDKIEQRLDVPNEGLIALNRICQAMETIGQTEWPKLEAVAAFAEAQSATKLRYLAENLDQFDFVPDVKNAEEYGRYMIQESRQFSFDPALEEFYDYAKYGEERMTHEEGRFIEQGYVSYHGNMTLDELMRDDPAEQERQEQQMGGMG